MKKLLKPIIFTALACTFLLGAGISARAASKVAINDENFSTSLISVAQEADKNGDGCLSKKEVSSVENIQFRSYMKEDPFKGLEYFTNLKDFTYTSDFSEDLSWEDIKNDTSTEHILNLSEFKKLESVDILCYSLYLKEIDLSGCSNLKEANIDGRGNIDKLNLRGCTNLKVLKCYDLGITKLNLSGLKKLSEVHVVIVNGGNKLPGKLKTLNLNKCSNLTSVYLLSDTLTNLKIKGADKLREIDCKYTQMTSLNLSDKKNLRKVNCEDNPNLTELDVSGCRQLRRLKCRNTRISRLNVKKNPDLKWLFCDNTEIKKLNLKNNKKLKKIDCRDTNIRNLNLPKTLKGKTKVKCGKEVPVTYKIK